MPMAFSVRSGCISPEDRRCPSALHSLKNSFSGKAIGCRLQPVRQGGKLLFRISLNIAPRILWIFRFIGITHCDTRKFLGKMRKGCNHLGVSRVSIYREVCDSDAWPSRRVWRASPAAAGEPSQRACVRTIYWAMRPGAALDISTNGTEAGG